MTNYWLDLFTPETWEEARDRGFKVTGFRPSRWSTVMKIQPGDFFVCYVTKLSRFCGKTYLIPEKIPSLTSERGGNDQTWTHFSP